MQNWLPSEQMQDQGTQCLPLGGARFKSAPRGYFYTHEASVQNPRKPWQRHGQRVHTLTRLLPRTDQYLALRSPEIGTELRKRTRAVVSLSDSKPKCGHIRLAGQLIMQEEAN